MKKHLALLLCLLGVLAGSAHASAQEAISLANEGTTGTTVGKLAKSTGAPSTAIITATTDTDHILGVVVAQDATATTGNAKIAVLGIVNCTFDASGVTAGHFVINSSVTAGDCADGTATRPTTNQVLGVALATVASGTAAVNLQIGYTNAAGSGTPGNPTATITTSAQNGSASTYMRSDAAPAASAATNATLGIMKGDTSTINCVAGTCTAVGGAATSITPGTTTITGATAPCLIENSTSTTMACPGVGTGVITALGVNTDATGGMGTIGTSGATVGLLNANKTDSGTNSFTGTNTFATVIGTQNTPTLTSNNYTVLASDCGKTLLLPTGTTPTLTLPNLNQECTVIAVQATSAQYTVQAASGGTLVSVNSYTKTKAQYATIMLKIIVPSASAATWNLSGDGA